MSFDYASLANDAETLIKEFGQQVTITSNARTYTPGTGMSKTPTAETPTAVLLPMGQTRDDDGGVRHDQQKLLVDGNQMTNAPKQNDLVAIGAEKYRIAGEPKVLKPGGTVLLYEILLEK